MAQLEQEGYLCQPHTSAGRVPTDRGYRFFVDALTGPGSLDPTSGQRVREFFARAHGAIEQMLRDTSQLLTELTDYAAVVVGPCHEDATILSVQLVGLRSSAALVLVVLSNGVVEKSMVDLDGEISDEHLAAATAHLTTQLGGSRLGRLPLLVATGDEGVDRLSASAWESIAGAVSHATDDVYVTGTSRMAAAFDAVESVWRILDVLEQQYVVVSLLRDVLDRGLSVSIGSEHQPLSECSIVVAPYRVEGEPVGSIGVLGPTRMNYPQALAAVAVVSHRLGRRLTVG
jgi:heat-inducible transcriptional repressor